MAILNKSIACSLLLFFFATQAFAQQNYTNLVECLQVGLLQNYDVLLVQNEETISTNNATRANAGMLPTIDLGGSFGGNRQDYSKATLESGEVNKLYGAYDQSISTNVGIGWTVFNGLKFRTNYQILKEKKIVGELQTRLAIEDFIASLTSNYYNYVQQIIRLRNFKYAVKLSAERLRIVEERFKIGSFSKLDLLQARVDFNADSSQYMSQQQLVKESIIAINELMANKDLTRPIAIKDSLIDVDEGLDYDILKSRLMEMNAELQVAEKNKTISELDLKAIRSRNYPFVNLSASYGYSNYLYGNNTTRLKTTLGPTAQLKLGYTIFDGNRKREQKNAQIEVENSRLRFEQLEQSLMADLSNFWQSYQNNLEVISLERENLIAARQNYEIAMERYKLGDLPGIDMREAQKSLLDAEERILTAEYSTKLCEISLQQVSGNVAVYLNQN